MKFCYAFLLVAIPAITFAQSNYQPGYVIKSNGDTLKGFVNYADWEQNPRTIDFKLNKEDRHAVNFNPQTIKELQVNGTEIYIAYQGLISMDKNKFPDLPLALDTNKKIDTIFLKQIVTGKYLTLFSHRDAVKTRFFVSETNAQPVELKYSQYYNSANEVSIKELYKGQLIYYIHKYLPDNEKLAHDAEDTKFNKTNLGEMVSAINGESSSVKKEAYFRFFVGGGIDNTKSHFRDTRESIGVYTQVGPVTEVDVYPETISKFSTTISPRVNFGIDAFTNPKVQNLILRAEMSFSYSKPKFQYLVYGGATNVTRTYSFDQYSATLTPQVILNIYNKNNFKFYLDGGIGLNFSTYSNTNLSKGTANDLQSFWTNFPFQAGIVINKKLEFSLTYAMPACLLNYLDYFSVNNQFTSIGLKYLFNTH